MNILFENLGFSGDDDDYYNPKNNFLNEVIDKKTGLANYNFNSIC